MRAPIALPARPSRIWRGAIAALLVLTATVIAAWYVTADETAPAWLRGGVVVATIALGASLVRLAAKPPAALRWTGAAWELMRDGAREPERGRADVALDLGGWMLLRFVPEGRRRVTWVPVERSGDAAAWHVLRSVLYSAPGPRP